jgi:ubiquinone/menaquinone biosynthesis C-methylase UbiE
VRTPSTPASDSTAYHLAELQVIANTADPRRCVPDYDCRGWEILDVGCGIGQTLIAPEFQNAVSLHGVDIDEAAIKLGKSMFPHLILKVGSAERIPYDAGKFDLVYSRVAIPYTNVPRAIAELVRVTKTGGLVWLSLHSWRAESGAIREALRSLAGRRLLDRFYVGINSMLLAGFGNCVARPWSGSYESFQLPAAMSRLLRSQNLTDVLVENGRHFLASGRKAASADAK